MTSDEPSAGPPPAVAVLIVTRNAVRLGHAADLVASLRGVEFPRGEWIVLIGDNASDDGSADFLAAQLPSAVVYRFGANLGFAEANNRLAQEALSRRATYAYLLNQDCTVAADFLRHVVDAIESDSSIGTVQSRILLKQQPDTLNTIGNAIHYLGFGFSMGGLEKAEAFPRSEWDRREIGYASGAGMLLRLELVRRIGLFGPELFLYHEDLDFGWQARLAGFRHVLAFDSVVYHQYEFGKNPGKYYYLERNRFLVLLENDRLATLLLLLPALVVCEIGLLGHAWQAGFLREKLRAYGYFLHWPNWRALLHRRAVKQRRRAASDRQILWSMTGSMDSVHASSIFTRLANPCFDAYYRLLRWIVFW